MQRKKEGSWWLWVPFLLMLATLFWMILARRKRQPRQNRPAVSPPTPHITLPPEEDAPPLADDLTVIRGIGPKTAGVLAQSGIRTFAQLAQSSPESLRDLLSRSQLRLPNANPEDWIAQAKERMG